MKKLILTILLVLPALLINAQGPIKSWNDQLDDFITIFNGIDPQLEQLYSDNGIEVFTFTYFEPTSTNPDSRYSITDDGNVIKEASIFTTNEYNKVDDQIMNQAKAIVIDRLKKEAAGNARLKNIIHEFARRKVNLVLQYTTSQTGDKQVKQIVISPAEL